MGNDDDGRILKRLMQRSDHFFFLSSVHFIVSSFVTAGPEENKSRTVVAL
jgi:hypothetical protein